MERWLRRGGLLVAILLWTFAANATPPINTNGSKYAVGGYDVVAYFIDGRPARGQAEYRAAWGGATWLFASADHKARFEREPTRYLPAYGGYCAYGVARGRLVPVAPEAFTIHRGRLYLNYSLDIRATWLENRDAYIERADHNWPAL